MSFDVKTLRTQEFKGSTIIEVKVLIQEALFASQVTCPGELPRKELAGSKGMKSFKILDALKNCFPKRLFRLIGPAQGGRVTAAAGPNLQHLR